MYRSGEKKKSGTRAGTQRRMTDVRANPKHPIYGTPRVLLLNSTPPPEDEPYVPFKDIEESKAESEDQG